MGVLMSDEFIDKVVKMKHLGEHLMMVRLMIEECLINVILG